MKSRSVFLLSLWLAVGASSAFCADEIYSKVDENPVPVRTVAPVAPDGQKGLVAVVCVVDENGKVIQASVSKSTNSALDQSAVEAIQAWSFKPAKKDGKAVKVRVTVPMRFEGA